MHIKQMRKTAVDPRWLSVPLVVKLTNTTVTTSSEKHQKQAQCCQQVPHWVLQGHDDQPGHHLASPQQMQTENRVSYQQVGGEEQLVRQDSQLLHNHGQGKPILHFTFKDIYGSQLVTQLPQVPLYKAKTHLQKCH